MGAREPRVVATFTITAGTDIRFPRGGSSCFRERLGSVVEGLFVFFARGGGCNARDAMERGCPRSICHAGREPKPERSGQEAGVVESFIRDLELQTIEALAAGKFT